MTPQYTQAIGYVPAGRSAARIYDRPNRFRGPIDRPIDRGIRAARSGRHIDRMGRAVMPHLFRGSVTRSGYSGLGASELNVMSSFWALAAIASSGASAYHGYKRNNSIGWAIAWGLLGGIAPVITPAVAVAQGFGERRRG